MPPQITRASALPGKTGKHENHIFIQMLYYCIARIQPAVWFIQSFLIHDSYSRCCMTP